MSTTVGCQSLAAKQWLSARPDAAAVLLGEPALEARAAGDGRGVGLFTTRAIPAFSDIFSESPTILLGPGDDLPQLYEQFLGLRDPGSDATQQKYLALSCHEVPERNARLREKLGERGFAHASIEEMIRVAGIMQTNAFNVDVGDGTGREHRGLFADVARINHSCAPNAHVCFYPPKTGGTPGRMVIHALRDLHAREEVLIAYFSILLPRPERQAKAQKWGFACRCSACEPRDAVQEQRRKAIVDFTAKHTALMHNRRPALKQIRDLIAVGKNVIDQVYREGSLRPTIPDLYDNLGMLRAKALLLQQGKERERAGIVEFLEEAAMFEARLTGPGSPATEKRLRKLEQFAARKDAPRIVFTGRRYEYAIAWSNS